MKAGTEWNEERNENRMWSVNYHARHAETENGLDWTHPKLVKCPFQRRTEAKHTYSFTKLLAYIACFRVFPRVGRGQRSRAYLMSFSNKLSFCRIEECFLCFSERLELDCK